MQKDCLDPLQKKTFIQGASKKLCSVDFAKKMSYCFSPELTTGPNTDFRFFGPRCTTPPARKMVPLCNLFFYLVTAFDSPGGGGSLPKSENSGIFFCAI